MSGYARWIECCIAIALISCCSLSTAQVVLKPNGQAAIPLRVKSLSANVEIDGQFAATHQTLIFQNETSERIEADFMYTLPPNTLVTSFAYWYGDEKVTAKVVEKEEAAAIYAHITTRMHDPALVEMIGKNTFRARIFPVMPNSDLKVEMTLVQTLPSDERGATFSYPLVVPHGEKLDHLRVNIRMHPDAAVTAVTNNYGLPMTRTPEGFSIALVGSNFRPDKDLNVHLVRAAKPFHAALCVTPVNPTHGYFALALTPDRLLKSVTVHIGRIHVSEVTALPQSLLQSHRVITLVGRYEGTGMATITMIGESGGLRRQLIGEIQFGTHPLYGPLAGRLWAVAWMERWSKDPVHRSKVMNLSYKFGLPSRYTSWLAVPREETARYAQEIEQARIEARTARLRAIAEAQIEERAHRLASLVVAGQGNSPGAKQLRLQLRTLCKPYGLDPGNALRDAVAPVLKAMGEEMAARIIAGRERDPDADRLAARLHLLCKVLGYTQQQVILDSLYPHIQDMEDDLLEVMAAGQQNTPTYRRIRDRVQWLYMRSGIQVSESELLDLLSSHGPQVMLHRATELVVEQHRDRPDPARIRFLRNRLDNVARWTKQTEPEYLANAETVWLIDAIQATQRQLLAEYRLAHPDTAVMEQLKARYRVLYVRWYAGHPGSQRQSLDEIIDEVADEAQLARQDRSIDSKGTGGVAVRSIQRRVPGLQERALHLAGPPLAQNVRTGDPLISVEAPADAAQVIAVMPAGEIKRLEYDVAVSRWQVRFDIPNYAAEGDYEITIVIVTKSGERSMLNIHYHVDLTPPNAVGKAILITDGTPTLRLELDAGEDAARVKAILPDGTMVELQPSSEPHRFFALAPINGTVQDGSKLIQFIVTDRAHNRTSITVDMTGE
jgi:hypothetical protein